MRPNDRSLGSLHPTRLTVERPLSAQSSAPERHLFPSDVRTVREVDLSRLVLGLRCEAVCEKDGAGEGTRTPDPIITNDVLYQLSYTGILLRRGPTMALLATSRRF
jgi:hypothetical protein